MPEALALAFEDRQWTFQQLDDKAIDYGRRLTAQGVGSSSLVALHVNNHPESVFAIHALCYIGARILLLNTRLTTPELFWQIEHAKPDFLLTTKEFPTSSINQILIKDLPQLEGKPFPIQETHSSSEVATIMYTSGTTGKPKAVQQTYSNHYYSAISSCENLGVSALDKWLCMTPIYHISGLAILFRSVICGISVHMLERFEPEQANRAIINDQVTIASVVSTMLTKMVAENSAYPTTFKGMLLGGGSVPKSLLKLCQEKRIAVFQTYGMTETCSQFATLAPVDSMRKLGSAGKPLENCELRIVNADGKQCLPNVSGEIVVKGPVVTSGYLYEENADAFADCWFHTGDIGCLDEEGYLFVLDRRSDLIISGGENIYPAEIEAVLLTHPHVIDAGVTGIADDTWGQVPIAVVVVNEPVEQTKLRTYCEERLAKYKVPKKIIIVEELPRNAAGKLLRRELKRLSEIETNSDS